MLNSFLARGASEVPWLMLGDTDINRKAKPVEVNISKRLFFLNSAFAKIIHLVDYLHGAGHENTIYLPPCMVPQHLATSPNIYISSHCFSLIWLFPCQLPSPTVNKTPPKGWTLPVLIQKQKLKLGYDREKIYRSHFNGSEGNTFCPVCKMPSPVFAKGRQTQFVVCLWKFPVNWPSVIMVCMGNVTHRLVCFNAAPTNGARIFWRWSLARGSWSLREAFKVLQPSSLPVSSLLPLWGLNLISCLKLLLLCLPHNDEWYPLLSYIAFVLTRRKVTNTDMFHKVFLKTNMRKDFGLEFK